MFISKPRQNRLLSISSNRYAVLSWNTNQSRSFTERRPKIRSPDLAIAEKEEIRISMGVLSMRTGWNQDPQGILPSLRYSTLWELRNKQSLRVAMQSCPARVNLRWRWIELFRFGTGMTCRKLILKSEEGSEHSARTILQKSFEYCL